MSDLLGIFSILAVLIIGGGTLMGAFHKMKGGFGPQNLKIVTIILVATLVSLAACLRPENINAAIGVLGAIVGYIFGSGGSTTKDEGA